MYIDKKTPGLNACTACMEDDNVQLSIRSMQERLQQETKMQHFVLEAETHSVDSTYKLKLKFLNPA